MAQSLYCTVGAGPRGLPLCVCEAMGTDMVIVARWGSAVPTAAAGLCRNSGGSSSVCVQQGATGAAFPWWGLELFGASLCGVFPAYLGWECLFPISHIPPLVLSAISPPPFAAPLCSVVEELGSPLIARTPRQGMVNLLKH